MDNRLKSQMMEKNSKKRKDALNASASSRSSRASSSRGSDASSRASDYTSRDSSSSFSSVSTLDSGMPYNNSMVAPSGEIISGYDLRAHLRQIMRDVSDDEESSDEYSVESYEDNEGDEELQRLMGQGHNERHGQTAAQTNENMNSQALVAVADDEDDGGDDLDSEEENAIMLEIKNEIKNNVRQEMKSELELYKAKLESLERRAGEKPSEGKPDPIAADLDHLEPKLRDAFIKMRKLDKILTKRVRQEKEVKKDRILLERRMRHEIEQLHSQHKSEYKEVTANEHKYLALELPPSHNEDTDISTEICPSTLPNSHSPTRPLSSKVISPNDSSHTINLAVKTPPFRLVDRLPCLPLASRKSVFVTELVDIHLPTDTPDIPRKFSLPLNLGFTPVPPRPKAECWVMETSREQEKSCACYIECSWVSSSCGLDVCDTSDACQFGTAYSILRLAASVMLKTQGHNNKTSLKHHVPSNRVVIPPEEFGDDSVFTTQLNEDEYAGIGSGDGSRSGKGTVRPGSKQSSECGSDSTAENTCSNASESGRKHRRKKNKDFIKRNKELAGDADNAIAMTEEEKKRLIDLLKDVDNIAELPEDEDNPYQVAVRPGEGFHPESDDLQSMVSIDSRLKEIMPQEEFESITSSSVSNVTQHKLFTHTAVKSDIDWQHRGEKALFEAAEQRDMNERLLTIEDELTKLHDPDKIELDTPRLDEDQLHDLIEQCVTSLSRTSMSRMTLTESRSSFADTDSMMGISDVSENVSIDNTPRSPTSARQELLDHPPRLDPVVLQQLLSEAYNPLYKQLSTLREENEDEETTPIPADVWKLISEQNVEESSEQTADRTKLVSRQCLDNDKNSEQGRPHSNNVGDLQNVPGARNGYMTLSRDSTSSSLSSMTDTGRESAPLKLPEIDLSGTLVTQGLNNQRFPSNQRSGSSNSSRTPIHMVRNSLSDSKIDNTVLDSQMDILSFHSEIMSPQPPSGEKRDRSAKSRTITPVNRPMT